MKFWPFIQTKISTPLTKTQIHEKLTAHTDNRRPVFYWTKTFNTTLWGNIKEDSFTVRPVVPYWNISPVHIKGTITDDKTKRQVIITMINPLMRVIIPLFIISITLLLLTHLDEKRYDLILNLGLAIAAGAYILVLIPFQIQARKTLKIIKKWLEE